MNPEQFQTALLAQLQGSYNKQKERIYYDSLALHQNNRQLVPSRYTIQNMGKSLTLFQLIGDVQVKHPKAQRVFSIPIIIHFGELYPKIPPSIKISNPTPQQTQVTKLYQSGDLYDGTIQISSGLLSQWKESSKIELVVEQIIKMFESDFPFASKQCGQQPHQNPQQQPQQQPKPSVLSKPAPNYQIKDEYNVLIQMFAKSIVEDIQQQRRYLDSLINLKIALDHQENKQKILENDLRARSEAVQNQIDVFSKFYDQNQGRQVNKDNVESLIEYTDPLSQQIIELTATNSGIVDTYKLIQEKHKRGEGPIDWCIQQCRKLAEQEFDNKLLLKKCSDAAQVKQ